MISDANSSKDITTPKNTSVTPAPNINILNGVGSISSILPTPITALSTALKNDIVQ